MLNYLNDKTFLEQLCSQYRMVKFVKITALDMDENPLEEIAGRISGGTINIDGSSIVRRSCNLTMQAPQSTSLTEYYWTLNQKFNLQIGLKNTINALYPEIIWFPMGIYLLTSFNSTENTDSLSISLSGQDKMCLLNGDISGKIAIKTDFAQVDVEQNDGTFVTKKLLLKDIILNAVHTYGKEPYRNIFINDLEQEDGLNLLEYRGNEPLYLLYEAPSDEGDWINNPQVVNFIPYGNFPVLVNGQQINIEDLPSFYEPTNIIQGQPKRGTVFWLKAQQRPYVARRVQYGEICGYEKTDLVYAGELVAAAGDNIANAVLEKIRIMLGNYEYFYDEYGHFIFQRKKTYLENTWSLEGDNILNFINLEEYVHQFHNVSLFTSLSNSPDIKKIKNDFTVWGGRKSITGQEEIPIHMRLVIDKKPTIYTSPQAYRPNKYQLLQEDGTYKLTNTLTTLDVDWRELIYQMAIDWKAHGHEDDFLWQIANANPTTFPTGVTGYEDYYLDLLTFWRELYNPFMSDIFKEISAFERPEVNDGSGKKKTIYTYAMQAIQPGDEVWENTSPDDMYVMNSIDNIDYYVPWIDIFNLDQDLTCPYDISNLYVYDSKDDDYKLFLDSLDFDYYNIQVKTKSLGSGYYSLLLDNQIANTDIEKEKIYYLSDYGDMVPYVKYYDIFNLPAKLSKYCSINSGVYSSLTGLTSSAPVALELVTAEIKRLDATTFKTERTVKKTWYRDFPQAESETATQKDYNWDGEDYKEFINNTSNSLSLNYFEFYYTPNSSKIVTKDNPLYFSLNVLPPNNKNYINIFYQETENKFIPLSQQLIKIGKYSLKDYYIGPDNQRFLDTIAIDKTLLYIKKEDGTFQSLPKYIKDNMLFCDQPIYRKTTNLEIVQYPEARKEYQYIYKADWKGQLIKHTRYPEKLHYFVTSTNYNPISTAHEDYIPGRATFWNRAVEDSPETLNFWFDMIDTNVAKELEPYSCSAIGHRPEVKQEKAVTTIYRPETPAVYFGTSKLKLNNASRSLFTISSLGQTAHNYLDELLYKHTYLSEGMTLNIVPMYWLQPNRKIKIYNPERQLNDDFIINKISIPLNYSDLMNLNVVSCSSIGLTYNTKLEQAPSLEENEGSKRNIIYDGSGLNGNKENDNIQDGGEIALLKQNL